MLRGEAMEPSRIAKWLTVVVMAIAVAATAYGTLIYGDGLMRLAVAYGPPGYLPQMYLWGAVVSAAIAAWIVTYLLCALIQRSLNVWNGFNLLPVLLLAVIGVNFGPHYAPQIWADLHYRWFEEADQKALAAVEGDNLSQIVVNNDRCRDELQKLGFPEFMFVASLGAPHGLDRARTKIKTARSIVLECQKRDGERLAKYRAGIEALAIDDKLKAQVLAAEFGDGPGSAASDRRRIRQLELQLIDEFEAMLNDLAAGDRLWYASSNQIIFVRRHDLDVFNAHGEKAKKLINEANALFAQAQERDRAKTREIHSRQQKGL